MSPNRLRDSQASRLAGFDSLRALSALAIVVYHVGGQTGLILRIGADGQPQSNWLSPFMARLDVGVAVFFVISGFLVFQPWLRRALGHQPAPHVGVYLKKRLLRIFPAYWLVLIVSQLFLGLTLRNRGDYVAYYGLLQIYDRFRALGGLPQAWSLCTELSFYLFVPLLGLLFIAWASRCANPRRLVFLSLLALVVLGLAFRVWAFSAAPAGACVVPGVNAWVCRGILWLPAQIDIFALGMILALMRETYVESKVEMGAVLSWLSEPAVAALAAVTCFWIVSTQLDLPLGLAWITVEQSTVQHILYGAVGFFLVVPLALGNSPRWMTWAPVAWLGTISYGIYLWHVSWMNQTIKWLGQSAFSGSFWPTLFMVLVFTIVCAWLSYLVLERPLLRRFGSARR